MPKRQPAPVIDLGTGRVGPAPDFRAAGSRVRAPAAVLPTTDAGNALVDELLRAGTQGIAVRRPLTRRAK